MTPVHLRRLCRDHLGTTPLGAVNARIVLEAKRLLVFSSLEVKEVAAAVGFADHAYFSRFFQRETGLAPTAFRATRRMTGPPPSAGPPRSADRPPATGRSAA
ncbi:MAG: helix-turn-helix transcriptional regulator [Pseudomonadota bacterium]|nr:helix-turn-helix transcriptional regulator [Pseudomonadota bacterium]